MFKEMLVFFDNQFTKKGFRFRKGHSTQQPLLKLLEKQKNAADKGKFFWALLSNL